MNKKIQNEISLAITIIGIFTLLTSIIYDYFYFLNLNISIFQIPISFSDITQSFLYWLPYSLSYVGMVFVIFWLYFPSGKFQMKISEKKLFIYFYYFVVAIMIFNLLIYILLGDAMIQLAVMGLVFFLTVVAIKINYRISTIIKDRIALDFQKLALAIFFLMGFFIYIGYSGYKDSWNLRNSDFLNATIFTINGKALSANILRSLDKGVIISIKSKPTEFIPWSTIESIKYTSTGKKFKGILCGQFNIYCKIYIEKQI
jgi:hypothetical protein